MKALTTFLIILVSYSYSKEPIIISDTLITQREALLPCSSSSSSDYHFQAIVSVPDLSYSDTFSYYYCKSIFQDTTISEMTIIDSDTLQMLTGIHEGTMGSLLDFRKDQDYYFLNCYFTSVPKELTDTLSYKFQYAGSWGKRGFDPSGNCSFKLDVPIDSSLELQQGGFFIQAHYRRLRK